LLVAFRPAPDLYNEALEVFYNINLFELNPETLDAFIQLKVTIPPLIRDLSIDLKYVAQIISLFSISSYGLRNLCSRWSGSITWDFLCLFIHPRLNLISCTRVQKLVIWIDAIDPTFYSIIDNCVRKWRELWVLILIDLHEQEDKALQMEAEIMEYLVEALKREEHTKDWEMVMKEDMEVEFEWATESRWMVPNDIEYKDWMTN
jgi:hypothetical protein